MKRTKLTLAVGALMLLAGAAFAAGVYTNGFPTVFAVGTTGNQTINGVSIGTGYTTLPLTGNELIPADTQLSGGRVPQTEAISVNQLGLFTPAAVALTYAATIAPDASLGEFYTVTLTGALTLQTPSNLVSGKAFTLRVNQDSTGSRVLTTASIPIYKWTGLAAGGVVLTTTANAQDMIACRYDGTFVLCTVTRDFVQFNGGRATTP